MLWPVGRFDVISQKNRTKKNSANQCDTIPYTLLLHYTYFQHLGTINFVVNLVHGDFKIYSK